MTRYPLALLAALALVACVSAVAHNHHSQQPIKLKPELLHNAIDQLAADHFERHKQRLQEAGTWEAAVAAREANPPAPVEHTCIHDHMMKASGRVAAIRRQMTDNKHERARAAAAVPKHERAERAELAKRATWEPLRVATDTSRMAVGADAEYTCWNAGQVYQDYINTGTSHTCLTEDVPTAEALVFITQTIIPAMVQLAESLLSVRQTSIRINSDPCAPGIVLPESTITEIDFQIYFTARPVFSTSSTSSTIANAAPCSFLNNGRPVVGYVNFNPSAFRVIPTSQEEVTQYIHVGFHELTHALGFTSALYDEYINADGDPYTTTQALNTPWGTRQFMITPRVTQFAQNQFSCPSLPGFGLESEGGAGTALSHWKQRLSGNEYMGGFISSVMPISNLTLALFEDMGWYQSNYANAQFLAWGSQLGCDFATQVCSADNNPYFCVQSSFGCGEDFLSRASCNVVEYTSDLDPRFRYFSDPRLGGDALTYDYCPFSHESYVSCTDPANQPPLLDFNGESFSSNSYCFPVNGNIDAGCYQVKCATDLASYQVQAFGLFADCPPDGGVVTITDPGTPSLGSVTIRCRTAVQVCQPASGAEVCSSEECVQDVGTGSDGFPRWAIWVIIGVVGGAIFLLILACVFCLCMGLCKGEK